MPAAEAPLAVRMRPRSLDELVGQEHLLGRGLDPADRDRDRRAALDGPLRAARAPGKTTLARIVATAARGAFEEESAVNAGRAEVRAMIERAAERRRATGQPTIFFLDEIHRFNKAQQDALLPAVEEGLVTLIGATTENPYFEVNSALLSRSQIYELRALEPGPGARAARARARRPRARDRRAAGDRRRGARAARRALGRRRADGARRARAGGRGGARRAARRSTCEAAEDALQRKAVTFDKQGDRHYDYASALIKSMRGSDPDAAIYYLAAMLEGGEDPRFIARRMVILASEDIGNADPQALLVATAPRTRSTGSACPSARSTSRRRPRTWRWRRSPTPRRSAISRAMATIREHGAKLPPDYLRDAHYPGAKKLGRGQGYKYAHDEPGGVSDQPLLPDEVQGARFYEPTDRGFEAELRERLDAARRRRGDA